MDDVVALFVLIDGALEVLHIFGVRTKHVTPQTWIWSVPNRTSHLDPVYVQLRNSNN